MEKPKIGIIGLGMVGMPLKRYFEEKGYKRGRDLFCYDIDPKKSYFDDVKKSNIIFVCAPSPRNPDGSCNTSIVESVIKEYGDKDKVLVIKSTVEPGTSERLAKKYKYPILFNPEFLTEARAWEDMIHPDRQIVGYTETAKHYAATVLRLLPMAFYSSPGAFDAYNFNRVNSTEAEFGKYASNIFGAMKVVFGNILADFCAALSKIMEKDGIGAKVDYENVKSLIAHDARIGAAWLDVNHGNYKGFGGYCFPKDTDAFLVFAKKMREKLSEKDKEEKKLKKLLVHGINFLESMRNYNIELLKSQGLTMEQVSRHDKELEEKLKNMKHET